MRKFYYLFLTLFMFICGGSIVLADDIAPVDEVLWADDFGDEGGTNTTFTKNDSYVSTYKYTGRSGYLTNAESVTYEGDENVILSTTSAGNVSGGHLWFCKQKQGVFTTSAIKLYGAKKVKFSMSRTKGKTIVSYSFNGSDWTQLWSDSGTSANADQNAQITTTGYENIYIKIQEGNNSNNLRVDNLKLTVVEQGDNTSTVTIGSTGYATFCPVEFDVAVPSGVDVYYVAEDGVGESSIKLTKFEGAKIKKGEGVILAGSGDVVFTETTEAEKIEGNQLLGVTADDELEYEAAYILSNKDGKAVFALCNAGTISAGKAYLINPAYLNAPRVLSIIIDDETTGINVTAKKTEDGTIFNLAGQKVDADYKGIIIVNGKKIIKK